MISTTLYALVISSISSYPVNVLDRSTGSAEISFECAENPDCVSNTINLYSQNPTEFAFPYTIDGSCSAEQTAVLEKAVEQVRVILHLISFSFTNQNLCRWNNNAFCNLYLGYDETEQRKNEIQKILYNIITRKFGTNGYEISMTLFCKETCRTPTINAFFSRYKYPSKTAEITFCPPSFNSLIYSASVPPFHDIVLKDGFLVTLGGILLHEMTHAFADTTDGEDRKVYGQLAVLEAENSILHKTADAWKFYGNAILTRMAVDKIAYPPETAVDALKLVKAGLNDLEKKRMCNSDFCKNADETRGKDLIRAKKLEKQEWIRSQKEYVKRYIGEPSFFFSPIRYCLKKLLNFLSKLNVFKQYLNLILWK